MKNIIVAIALGISLLSIVGCSAETGPSQPVQVQPPTPKPVPTGSVPSQHIASAKCSGGASILDDGSLPVEWVYSLTVTKVPSAGQAGAAVYCVDVGNSAGGQECKVDVFTDDSPKEGVFQQTFAGQPFRISFNALEQDVRTETLNNRSAPNPCVLAYR